MEAVKLDLCDNFSLLDLIEYPVVVVSTDTRVIYSNPSVTQLLNSNCKDNFLSQLLQCQDGLNFEITPSLLRCKQPIRCTYNYRRTTKHLDAFIKASNLNGNDIFVISFVDVSEYVKREQALFEEATIDSLTGIATRRRFLFQLDREINRADRENSDFALLLIDIDHFKLVNDKYGHAAGDTVLQYITHIVKQELRDIDVFGRLGGEEFGLVLPGANLEKAHFVADRIRQIVKNTSIELEQDVINITISIGMIAVNGKASRDILMRQVDNALYAAKHSGRDAVRSYTLFKISANEVECSSQGTI